MSEVPCTLDTGPRRPLSLELIRLTRLKKVATSVTRAASGLCVGVAMGVRNDDGEQ